MKQTRAYNAFGIADAMAILLSVIWGSNYVVVKQTLARFSPMSFNGLRFIGASLFLLLALRLMGEDWRIRREDIARLIALGLISITLYQVCFINGLNLSTATNTSLILATSPTLVVILGSALGMERVNGRAWLGISLALVGLLFVIGGKSQGLHFGLQTLRGDLLALVSSFTWAIYTLFVRPLFRHYSSIKATAIVTAVGAVPLVVLSLPEWANQDWGRIGALDWGGLAYSTIFSIALGYIIYYYCVKRLGGTRAIAYYNLSPVISVVLAFLVLGERMTVWQAAGAIIVIIGVYLTRRSQVDGESLRPLERLTPAGEPGTPSRP